MNYAEFKTYLATFLWKQNDLDLIANLDNLILMGTTELDHALDITRREVSDIITLVADVTNGTIPLPADFKQMRALSNAQCVFVNATVQQILKARVNYTGVLKGKYHVTRDGAGWALQVAGSAVIGDQFGIEYRAKLPDFAGTDASWLADDYLDLYTYTILKHCAPFLREDERIQVWQTFAGTSLTTVIEEDRHLIAFGGADTAMNPSRPASARPYPSRSGGGYGSTQA